MRHLYTIIAAVCLAVSAFAQTGTTNITASHIESDLSGSLLTGKICLTPQLNGHATGFTANSGAQVMPSRVCYPVSNGVLSINVPDTSLAQPSGIGYHVDFQQPNGLPLYSYSQNIYPNGSTWNLDAWAPTQTANVTSPTIQYLSSAPSGNCGTAPAIAYVVTDIYTCEQQAWQKISLTFNGGAVANPITLPSDPTQNLQAATKQYVDAHGANLPANAIPFQGTSGTSPVPATPANIASPFTSTTFGSGSYTAIQTSFNEGASGTTIVGTKPATDIPNTAWVGGSAFTFTSGGAAAGSNNGWSFLNTGTTSSTITYTVTSVSGTVAFGFNSNSGGTNQVQILKSGTTWSLIDYGGAGTLATATVSATSGTIAITISGTSVSATVFGTPLSGTLSGTSGALSNTNVGLWTASGASTAVSSLTVVSAQGYAANQVACAGFLNSDGTCSTPSTNAIAATDSNGHFTLLPELGTATTNQAGGPAAPVTRIAWQDDFSAGVYDPRDPRWGAQDTKAHQAAALQAMSNQMACDISMGKVSQAVAKFPQGAFAVDNLLAAPGSEWIGSPLADGGTTLYTFVNNHQAIQMPGTMTVTCSDGLSHTDNAGLGMVSHFLINGCSTGGCTNATGDTATYINGGPNNTGITLGTNGELDHTFAQNFGGEGIIMNSQDAKGFHLRTISNLNWYYYGGYKGVGESAASAEASAVTTGTTGSVALSWTAVSGATGYVVYRGTTAGGENNSFLVTTNSFTDTCAAGNTGAVGTVTNVVTETTAATPGTITATPSTTGGTCAAGTYYYKVTATIADGWHGSMRLGGLDTMVDWAEAYGQFDAPTKFTYHHLADILTGGGYGHFDHLWPQLGLVGIAQPYSYGTNDHIENFRVDFARLEGVWTHDTAVYFENGIVDGSCTASNALTVNTGQDDSHFAGLCTQFLSTGIGNNLDNVWFGDNPAFGATVKTADILMEDGSSTIQNTNGSIQFASGLGMLGGGRWWAQTTATTGVTGATPSIRGVDNINPTDTTPITETGFTYGITGQVFYVWGGNANVTIQNNSNIKTCSGQNINLGSVNGPLQFRVSGSGVFTTTANVSQVCTGAPTALGTSETVAYSAMPTFSSATGTSYMQLTGNVTSFALAAGTDGQAKTLVFCNDATGGYTVTPPANVRGFMTVGTTASKCSSQHLTYSAAQSAWLADSAGVVNE